MNEWGPWAIAAIGVLGGIAAWIWRARGDRDGIAQRIEVVRLSTERDTEKVMGELRLQTVILADVKTALTTHAQHDDQRFAAVADAAKEERHAFRNEVQKLVSDLDRRVDDLHDRMNRQLERRGMGPTPYPPIPRKDSDR